MEYIKLSDLNLNEKCRLIKINATNLALRRRLLDMGLTKGSIIEIKMISPLKDPISILVRGYILCLRKSDMDNILVERI